MLTRREIRGIDRSIVGATLLLIGIGLAALYSATSHSGGAGGAGFLHKQIVWAFFGMGLAVLLTAADYHRWMEGAYLLYGLNLLLLLLVLEVGAVRGGAQRWLSLGGWTVQPSEFAKVTAVLALARLLGGMPPVSGWQVGRQEARALLSTVALLGIPMALILQEPNLGTALVFVPIGLAMLLVWGVRLRVLTGLLLAGLAVLPFLWGGLADYQRSRLMVFVNPNADPLGAGYTVIQSKIAIGSGGLWGKGWLSGTQNQLNFLPERHTDFIFSVVGEEWGFLGGTVCLALFAFLFYRSIRIAAQTRDPYGRLLVAGLVAMLATHVVVNTGMTVGLMPVVGLPLPLMSYGGSSVLTTLSAIGIILSVGVRRPFI